MLNKNESNKIKADARKELFLLWTMFVCCFVLGSAITSIYWGYKDMRTHGISLNSEISSKKIPQSEKEITESCSNLTLQDTARCLVGNIDTFYNFTITDDNEYRSLDDLKKVGGDCLDYSLLYNRLINQLGFYGSHHIIDINNTSGHAFATMSDEEGYCILDQTNYRCFSLR